MFNNPIIYHLKRAAYAIQNYIKHVQTAWFHGIKRLPRLVSPIVIMAIACIVQPTHSQASKEITHLKAKLLSAKVDTTKIRLLNRITDLYIAKNATLAKYYNQQAWKLSQKPVPFALKAKTRYLSYKIAKVSNQNEEALRFINETKGLFLKANDLNNYTLSLVDEGGLYVKKQDLKKASEVLLRAKGIFEKLDLKGDLSLLYTTIGSLYHKQGNDNEAINFHKKSLQLNIADSFKLGISANYINLGVAYNSLKDYPKAQHYFEKALIIKKSIGDKAGLLKCYNNLGVICMNTGNTTKAIEYHTKSMEIAESINSLPDKAMCQINLGYDYQKAGNYLKAIHHTTKGLELAKLSKDLSMQQDCGKVLSECFAKTGQYETAYEMLNFYKKISDSLTTINNAKEISNIQTQYQSIQKDNQIKSLRITATKQELNIQQLRNYSFLALFLLVVVILLVLFFRQKAKNAKKVQNKLQEINNLKNAFFANLSHEFRTPLTLMLGPAEKLLETASDKDRPLLQLIHRNARRMLSLDEQLLEFTKIDSGVQKLKLQKGNIVLLVNAIVNSFSLQAIQHKIILESTSTERIIDCYFDTDIIEKVIGNLISNAIKYTPNGGSISVNLATELGTTAAATLATANKPNNLIIQVIDTGLGIAKEKQDSIFDRFYQVKNYSSEHPSGYGIGLALVKELITLHKGHISLTSNPGKGSVFTVKLSLDPSIYSTAEINETTTYNPTEIIGSTITHDNDYTSRASTSFQSSATNKQKSSTVLIVDDNLDMRLYLNEILGEHYHVLEAQDGLSGLEKALAKKPDVIVTDIMMETMDGVEFCRRLKMEANTKSIPVILLTALTSTDQKVEGFETGAEDYITKPFHANELLARIASLIKQRAYLKDLFSNELKLEPKAISVASSESVFIQRLINLIEKHIDNPDLDVELLASEIGLSRSQLHRKITSLTNQSTTGFIKVIRIKRAAQLLAQKAGNVSEIMYMVGFNNLSYFAKSFKEVYQITPSEYSQTT